MRIQFDDDATPKGLEGWYEVKNDTLVVFVNPTSKGVDWVIDFLALPVPVELVNLSLGWCHIGFKSYAYWLTGVVWKIVTDNHNIKKVVLSGYSMGGGVAQLTAIICKSWINGLSYRVVSIDGPRTTTKLPDGVVYYNKGSIVNFVPPWFKRLPEKVLNTTRTWFWKAHWITPAEIDNILNGEYNND